MKKTIACSVCNNRIERNVKWSAMATCYSIYKIISSTTGLILVPNGENIGYALGDTRGNYSARFIHRTTAKASNVTLPPVQPSSHTWGIFFTILGTVMLDFDADACQSPSRAYLLDVTLPGK